MENDINLAYQHLPSPFKEFNDSKGKEIYNSILYKPTEDTKDPSDKNEVTKSLMILHLTGNSKELIELLEKNKAFLIKSGHMSLEDQTMIIEILFDHAFKQDKIYHKNLIKLCNLLKEFTDINYQKLNLVLDWKPCFNTFYAVLTNSDVKMEMFALSAKKNNFYNLVEKIFLKLNKFFRQGSATELFNTVKPYLFYGHPKFLANMLCFSILVPNKRFNTDEDEVQEWLPFIVDLWKTIPFNSYYRSIFMRLLAQVTQYFNRLDFSEYDKWVAYQLNLAITRSNQGGGGAHAHAHSEKFFAQYYVNTFKSTEHLKTSEEMKDEGHETNIDMLVSMYSDYLHPNNKFSNKASIIFLIKHISTALCCRVRFERTRLSEDPDYRYKYLFLEQPDINRFTKSLQPILDMALQDEKLLDHLSFSLKNFITLDCDSILSMFLFTHFKELDELTSTRFIPILNETVVGALVNQQSDSQYKYEFIQNVIEYLLAQVKSLEVTTLKAIIQIFNSIWSVLPVLPNEWGKELIERTSKSKDYTKYMRTMSKKRVQEYQFYKLYEKINDYAIEYFKTLKTIMNLGIPIKDELIRGFWYLLNAMDSKTYSPLIEDLIDTANQDHAKSIIGGVLCNIASRDSVQAEKIVDYALGKLLSKEGDKFELTYHNYAITEFYLIILYSVIYQNREAAEKHIDRIFDLLQLLVKGIDKDHERNNVLTLIKSMFKPFVDFEIEYKGLLSEDKLSSDEYMAKLWFNNNTFDEDKINMIIRYVDVDHVKAVQTILNSKLLSWLKDSLSNATDKNTLKTLSGILKDAHMNL